jgi:rsbT co-antagonist protein RsbR
MIEARSPEERTAQQERSAKLIEAALVDGDWDPYLRHMAELGAQYCRAGLSFRAWFTAVGTTRRVLSPILVTECANDSDRLVEVLAGMARWVDLTMSAVGQAYLDERQRTIAAQHSAIRELSTPVLQLPDDVLLMPLVGAIDSDRAAQMTQVLLHGIAEHRARAVVLDVTGVVQVDTAVADHLIRTVRAARLMGCESYLTGLSVDNAQTLVRLGADMSEITTLGTLRAGLLAAAR